MSFAVALHYPSTRCCESAGPVTLIADVVIATTTLALGFFAVCNSYGFISPAASYTLIGIGGTIVMADIFVITQSLYKDARRAWSEKALAQTRANSRLHPGFIRGHLGTNQYCITCEGKDDYLCQYWDNALEVRIYSDRNEPETYGKTVRIDYKTHAGKHSVGKIRIPHITFISSQTQSNWIQEYCKQRLPELNTLENVTESLFAAHLLHSLPQPT